MTQQVAPISVPLYNGFIRSFAHVRLEIAGMQFSGGFKSIMRKRARTREQARSNNADPVAKTVGENKYECKAEMYLDWYYNLIATIDNTLGVGYADQPFTIYISYVGTNLVPYTDQVLGCTFDIDEGDDKQGTAALVRTVDFTPLKILFNGLDDNADPLVAPPQ